MAHQSRALIALLLTLGLVALLLPSVALAAPPAGSCIGVDACTGNTGSLQTDACVGEHACFNNAGSINKKACQAPDTPVGVGGVCQQNTGSVGVGACQGIGACSVNQGAVSKEGCDGQLACLLNRGAVGEGACVGPGVCREIPAGSPSARARGFWRAF